jgi:hypothetical protein
MTHRIAQSAKEVITLTVVILNVINAVIHASFVIDLATYARAAKQDII